MNISIAQHEPALLHIICFSDSHLASEPEQHESHSKVDVFFAQIKSAEMHPPPDLLISLGDLLHDRDAACERKLRDHVEKLGIPCFATPGNHDAPQEALALQTEAVDLGHCVLLMIDNSGGDDPADGRLAERNERVRTLLSEYAHQPLLIACHVPLLTVRDPAVLSESFGLPNWQTHDAELRSILHANRSNILGIVSGHLHLTGHTVAEGLHQFVGSGLLSWPHDYLYIELTPKRMVVKAISLTPAWNTNDFPGCRLHNGIHDRHAGREFTDAAHPTFELYLKGTDAERSVALSHDRGDQPDAWGGPS